MKKSYVKWRVKSFVAGLGLMTLQGMLVPDAAAHPQDMGLLKASVRGSAIEFSLELTVPVAAAISGVDPATLLDAHSLARKADVLLQASLAENALTSSQGVCPWSDAKAVRFDEKVRLTASANCPAEPTSWSLALPFLHRANRGFELLVQAELGGKHRDFVISATEDRLTVSAGIEYPWTRFVGMGIHHIGAAPSEWRSPGGGLRLPDGIDHILFVLALVLGGGGWLGILKTVTGFTLGHSVTLALATLGIIQLPSRVVESAIALSIAVVAAESLFLKRPGARWKIALAFGLVHGLGFASALSELHLDRSSLLKALVGFNGGVELGQAIIVAIALPLLFLLKNPLATRRFVVPALASLILVVGSYWFVRRAFAI